LRQIPLSLEAYVDKEVVSAHFGSSLSSSFSSDLPQRSPLSPSPSTPQQLFVQNAAKTAVSSRALLHSSLPISTNPVNSVQMPTAAIHQPAQAMLRIPASIRTDLTSEPHTIAPHILSAWAAAAGNWPVANVHGVTLENPRILARPSSVVTQAALRVGVGLDPTSRFGAAAPEGESPRMLIQTGATPPPEGFVLTGDITLFGPTLKGTITIDYYYRKSLMPYSFVSGIVQLAWPFSSLGAFDIGCADLSDGKTLARPQIVNHYSTTRFDALPYIWA
jgi:hypothetical protein